MLRRKRTRICEPSGPSNYRPISLLPPFVKVLEAQINSELIKLLTSQNLLLDRHYVFRFSRSVTNVFIYQSVYKNSEARTVALGISKASDRVSHTRLHTLKDYIPLYF